MQSLTLRIILQFLTLQQLRDLEKKLKDAVGHMVSYYYDKDGNIIENENDIVYRITVDQLKKADVVMGICRCNVTVDNLIGALKTGILTHIFVDQQIAQEVVKRLYEPEVSL